MSFTTDGTQRITIISRNSAVNDSANICHFIRRAAAWSSVGRSVVDPTTGFRVAGMGKMGGGGGRAKRTESREHECETAPAGQSISVDAGGRCANEFLFSG